MKKRLFWLLVVALTAVLVVGCAPAATPAPVEEPMEEPAEEPMEEPAEEPMEEGEPAECAADEFGCAVISPGTTIKLGFAGPTLGEYAAFGVDISQGGLIAIDDFGEFEGFQFELVIEDTGGSPEVGAAVANRFVSDQSFVAIAGHTFSGETEASMPIYEQAGLPMVSASATNPDLTALGSRVFNRIAFTDTVQGEDAAAYLFNTLGVETLAVIHDGGAYGQGLAEVVRDNFTALGGEVVDFSAITVGETDYSAALARIGALAPDAVFFGGYYAEAVVLVSQMGGAGLGDAVFFSDDGTYGQSFIDLAGAAAEGVYATSLIPPSSTAKEAFDATYEERFGTAPGVLSPYSWNGYDMVAVLIHSVKQVAILGGDGNLYIPRGALVEAVRGLEGYEGLSGDITCDDVGECNTAGPTFYYVENGEWVEAP